jgi:LemA protein
VDQSFSAIDTYLKKRYDLIPNLVATAKTFMKHESELLIRMSEIRTQALSASKNSLSAQKLDQEMGQSVGKFMASVESYPQLKSQEHFAIIMQNLTDIESQLSAARRAYNSSVTFYNDAIEMIPHTFVASLMGLKKRTLFEIYEAEKANPNIKNLFGKAS